MIWIGRSPRYPASDPLLLTNHLNSKYRRISKWGLTNPLKLSPEENKLRLKSASASCLPDIGCIPHRRAHGCGRFGDS
ncbi:hypothetical protein TNIN_171901 [Trichonephila inaurata madagascariensis]|uniref:Uncharacterized protein n=1 Tax=Trichonephila inaurata madagascariensis TaxID=2747483 RepID=A0A8X6Y6J8_9ARAC|nr:hypothetical protein TNIN_171901 [Trichonephila inaurata madagascariensis]